MIPIYEQIIDQIKTRIRDGSLKVNDSLPSVRALAKDLRVSALTVKKAYDILEEDGFIKTVHGKGSYIMAVDRAILSEEAQKEAQRELEKIILKCRMMGLKNEEIKDLFMIILEEQS